MDICSLFFISLSTPLGLPLLSWHTSGCGFHIVFFPEMLSSHSTLQKPLDVAEPLENSVSLFLFILRSILLLVYKPESLVCLRSLPLVYQIYLQSYNCKLFFLLLVHFQHRITIIELKFNCCLKAIFIQRGLVYQTLLCPFFHSFLLYLKPSDFATFLENRGQNLKDPGAASESKTTFYTETIHLSHSRHLFLSVVLKKTNLLLQNKEDIEKTDCLDPKISCICNFASPTLLHTNDSQDNSHDLTFPAFEMVLGKLT